MAEISYLKLKNTTTGEEVIGDCPEKAFKEWIEVQGFDHTVSRSTHPQTGRITSEPKHESLQILKPIDQASPVLQQALSEGHYFDGQVHFVRTSKNGQKEHWYTIAFERAALVQLKTYKPNVLEGNASLPDLEKISFRFERISWRHEQAGKEASYDWTDK